MAKTGYYNKRLGMIARETGQEAVAPPEFPADGRALLCNIVFIVQVADVWL